MMFTQKSSLYKVINKWMEGEQVDDSLHMYISDDLVEHMTNAAWSVLLESRATQRWLQREEHLATEEVK